MPIKNRAFFTDVEFFPDYNFQLIGECAGKKLLLIGRTKAYGDVVSSLWTVSATATALLMIRFFEELQQQINIAVALNTAQRWLGNTTVQGFRDWLSKSQLSEEWQDELDKYFEQIEEEQGAATKCFESPFYWSAFCAIGKGV